MKRKMMVITSIVLGVLILIVFVFTRIKQVNPLGWNIHSPVQTSGGYAISGYDPVAYFNGNAEAGLDSYQHEWGGAKWKFSSAKNIETFKDRPDQFAPQFGGYCSFAVSKGFTAKVDPEAWHVHEGKLYLFADQKVKKDWIEAITDGVIEKCQKNWN